MNAGNGSSLAGFVSEVLATPGHRARLRLARPAAQRFGPELSEAFRRRAVEILRSDPREAGRRAQLALVAAEEVSDDAAAVRALETRTKAALTAGALDLALASIMDATERAPALGDEIAQADVDLVRVQVLTLLERHLEARTTCERILAVFEKAGDTHRTVLAHMALADVAFRMDRPRLALRHHAAVDGLLPQGASERARATLAVNRANALEASNRFRAATRHFEHARELFASAGCEHTEAQVEYNLAYAEMLRGRFEEALKRLTRVEQVFHKLDDRRHLAHVQLDRAEIHLHLHLPADAAEFAEQAEAAFQELGLLKETAQAAHLAGRAAELDGRMDAADEAFARAQAVFLDLGLHERELGCIVQRACTAEAADDLSRARSLADEAAERADEGMNPVSVAAVRLLSARLELAARRPVRALHIADRVRYECRRVHAPWVHIEALRITGRANVGRGDVDQAIVAYKQAIDHLERYRGGVPPDEYMAAFLAGRAALYDDIVDLLVVAGHTDLAFEYAERAKSRALVDLLAERRGGPSAGEAGGPSARRVRYLRERLNALYQRIFQRTGDGDTRSTRFLRHARRRAGELEHEIADLLRRQRLLAPEATSLESVDAPDLAEIQADLPPGTALLEYFLTRDALFIFVVTCESTHVERRPVGETELHDLIGKFHYHLARGEHPREGMEQLVLDATRANLKRIADELLVPVAGHLDAERLVIVPHGRLHHLPFHALPWQDGWVADRFEVVYAPSAAVYRFCGQTTPSAGGPPCVLGLPDENAPRIADESRRTAAALGGARLYLGADATFEALRSEAQTARIVHIATHGMFRHEHPMLSSIRLADRWVNLYDLYGLDVRGELVVLSTCESGIANVTGGDEIVGLTRGFLYAGAPALLTSQWAVNDAVTAEFMESFYRCFAETDDAAGAYRRAMSEVRAQHPHPYFWAPFFLTGRPAERVGNDASAHAGTSACSTNESQHEQLTGAAR